jgi:hypothetical protein
LEIALTVGFLSDITFIGGKIDFVRATSNTPFAICGFEDTDRD